jgi:putative DNA primase/helicase
MTEKKVKPDVTLLALSTMDGDNEKAYRYVEFSNQNNGKKVRRLFAATDIAEPRLILNRLFAEGLRLDLEEKDKTAIAEILRKNVKERVQLCLRPGFTENGKNYLTANGEVFGNTAGLGPLPYPEAQTFFHDEQAKGDLDGWQEKVASLAKGNSRLILALSSAFSGPCIHLTDIESGGFHFYAPSSQGKSTLMLMAASVFGNNQFVKKWNMTDAAFEQAAEARNDGILLLDELKLLGSKKSDTASLAQSRIYILGSGEGKQRHTGYQKTVSRWRLVMLSTGEFSLGQHASDGSLTRLDGEKVRVVDVPAEAGADFGIFDAVPEKLTPRRLAERIQYRCNFYHGTAGPVFITKMLEDGRNSVKKKIKAHITHFIEHHEVDEEDGITVRIAKRFALAYAGGILASEYGILPLTEEEIMAGISSCYSAANGAPVKGFDFSKKFKAMLELKLPNLKKNKSYTEEKLDRKPIILTEMNKIKVYAVDTAFFEENIRGKVKLKDVLQGLRTEEILLLDSNGKNTRAVPYNRESLKRRYCLIKDKLDIWLTGD